MPDTVESLISPIGVHVLPALAHLVFGEVLVVTAPDPERRYPAVRPATPDASEVVRAVSVQSGGEAAGTGHVRDCLVKLRVAHQKGAKPAKAVLGQRMLSGIAAPIPGRRLRAQARTAVVSGEESAGAVKPARHPSDADPRARQQSNTGSLADLSRRFWVLSVDTGVVAGLGAIAMMAVLRSVQHVAFSYHSGEYSAAAARHSDLRRLAVLGVGGLATGLGLWTMRRFLGGTGGQPTAVVWSRRGRLSLPLTTLSGALSECRSGWAVRLVGRTHRSISVPRSGPGSANGFDYRPSSRRC